MSLKDWPYWLKCGITVSLFPIIVFIVNFLIDITIGTSRETFLSYFLIISIPALPIFNLFLKSSISYNITYLIFFVSTLIIYFIIGCVIGFVYYKVKKRSG